MPICRATKDGRPCALPPHTEQVPHYIDHRFTPFADQGVLPPPAVADFPLPVASFHFTAIPGVVLTRITSREYVVSQQGEHPGYGVSWLRLGRVFYHPGSRGLWRADRYVLGTPYPGLAYPQRKLAVADLTEVVPRWRIG